jgi:hypothetical protein
MVEVLWTDHRAYGVGPWAVQRDRKRLQDTPETAVRPYQRWPAKVGHGRPKRYFRESMVPLAIRP